MSDALAFVMIYIAEAHASDGWKLGRHVEIKDHLCIEDRGAAACVARDRFHLKVPILLDSMQNSFDQTFAVWPERYYVIGQNKKELLFISYPTDEFGISKEVLANVFEAHGRDIRCAQMAALRSDAAAVPVAAPTVTQ